VSQAKLCSAVKTAIVDALDLTNTNELECDVMFDGQPKPMAGKQFVGIWPGSWVSETTNLDHIEETYGVNVTVTRRLTQFPKSEWAVEAWLAASDGVDKVCRQIIVAVHGSYAILQAWVTAMGGSPQGEAEPLWFQNSQGPQLKYADWFESDDGSLCGVAQTLIFGGARRVQNLDGPAT
jgi:hypothetical protein